MKSLSILISALCSFQSLIENAFDHHTAIYYLLVDRLRQHRASYPLHNRLEMKLRRPSGIAEAAVIRGTQTTAVMVPARSIPRAVTVQPMRVPYFPLQNAINQLRERIPTPPEIRREIANECMKELSPLRELGGKARSISPRQMISPPMSVDNCIQRHSKQAEDEKMDSSSSQPEEKQPAQERRHSAHAGPLDNCLKVPREHPLLKRLGSGDERVSRLKPAIVVSHHGPSGSATSPLVWSSRGSGQHLGEPPRSKPASYNLCRRASDGTTAISAFQQNTREIAVLNRIKQLQQEHQKLQEQYQKSLSPYELSEQQALHTQYKQKYEEMREQLQRHYEELMALSASQQSEVMQRTEGLCQNEKVPPHPLPLLHQFQKLHIENRHNPLRRTPYNQNPHKQVFRTSSYKRAQMDAMLLPPLESEAPTEGAEEPQDYESQTRNPNYSMIALWLCAHEGLTLSYTQLKARAA